MNRNWKLTSLPGFMRGGLVTLLLCLGAQAQAVINGWMGDDPSAANGNARTFVLTAKHHFVSTSDGNSHYAWGYAHTGLPMQYPGPTLIVNQGDTVKIVLNNTLPVPVSMIFPGQADVLAEGGEPGLLTREARAVAITEAGIAAGPTYTFVAGRAGTYLYQSGTNTDLQVEMGLVGALIVRPTNFAHGTGPARVNHPNRKAYLNDGTGYDRENLFLLTEMDPELHWTVYSQVFSGSPVQVDTTAIHASIWFINGRNAPDTMQDEFVDWLPTQPYNALPRMHAGERLLMRVVNAGRDLHPFHHHGNHAAPIARDGRVLTSVDSDSQVPDVSSPDFTVRAVPGQTVDLIFEWTGKGIGWDVYGTTAINPHTCNADSTGFDPVSHEWCADHNKPIPVQIPGQLDVSYGELYGGTPYLGRVGTLPQGHPALNNTGSYFHMWHSHNEREITSDNIFPGGMMTMAVIEPMSVDLESVPAGGPGGGGGTGPAQAAIALGQPFFDATTLTVLTSYDGATLAFGDQGGGTKTATMWITVTGTATTFGAITVANNPSTSSRFSMGTDSCSGQLKQPGQVCQLQIRFDPTGSDLAFATLTMPYAGGAASLALTGR